MISIEKPKKLVGIIAFILSIIFVSAQLYAAGTHSGGHGHKQSFGEPGNVKHASRTINVKMLDSYYQPKNIEVKEGETIVFKVENVGVLVHEFNIGTAIMHDAHQKEMINMFKHGAITPTSINHKKMNMGNEGGSMKHDDPNSVLLNPGQSSELVWKFTKAANLEFACNIPGHYQAGMMGKISF